MGLLVVDIFKIKFEDQKAVETISHFWHIDYAYVFQCFRASARSMLHFNVIFETYLKFLIGSTTFSVLVFLRIEDLNK